jgi:hypothetical protein
LKLSFKFGEITDWMRNIRNMRQFFLNKWNYIKIKLKFHFIISANLKRLHLSEGQLTRQVVTTMLSIWSNLEDLSINKPTAVFRCTCERRRYQWYEECVLEIYVLLSRFQRLRRFSISGDMNQSQSQLIR